MEQIDLTKILKVGDKVWNFIYQRWECIVSITSNEFIDTNFDVYTFDGKQLEDHKILSITWKEWHPESGEPFPSWKDYKPHHQFKAGELVWVKGENDLIWNARYFSHYQGKEFATYTNQKRNSNDYAYWEHCLPFDQRPF